MQGALLKDVSAEELAGIYTEVAEENDGSAVVDETKK